MASSTDLRVKISADLAEIKQGLGLLRGELAKVKQQSAQALGGSAPNALVTGLKRARTELASFVAAYASLAGAKLLAGIADEAKLLRGRMKEAKGDYEAILAVANNTRSGLSATVDLYARIERSTRGQISNQAELLGITKSVNQAIKLSYADTSQSEAAVMQLGQALSSGKLQGDEFRSISENAPRLMQAIADGMGVARESLKKLSSEGKLTTQVIIDALRKQAGVLNDEYARVPVTIGDAMTQVRNSFVDFIGKADQANGASARFAAALQQVAKDLPKYLNPLLDAVRLLAENMDALAVFVGTRLALAAIPALIGAFTALRTMIISVRAATISLEAVLAVLGGPAGIALAALAAALYLVYKATNKAKEAEDQHRKVMEEIDGQVQKNIVSGYQLAAARRQEARDSLEAAQAQLKLARARFEAENTSVTARGGDRGDAAALASTNNLNAQRNKVEMLAKQEAELTAKLHELEQGFSGGSMQPVKTPTGGATGSTASKAFAASNALQRDAVTRAIAEVERLYKASEIGTKEYFSTLTSLQQQAIDLQIQQARNELAVTTDKGQRLKLEEQITILQRDRADVAQRNARDEKQASDAMIDKLGDVKAQLAELDGDAAKAARIRIYAQFHDLFKQLEVDSDETGKAMVQNLVDRLVNKAEADAITSRVSSATSGLSALEQSISAQMDAGALGQGEGERRLREIRQKTLDQLRQLREEQRLYMEGLKAGTPEHTAAIEGLASIDTSIANVVASQNKFKMAVQDQAVNSLSGFFDDLIDGAKSFKEAFLDMVRSFVAGVAKMIAQELALKAVRGLFSMFGGGGGQAAYEGALAAGAINAKGNAFDTSGLRAFARGAVFPAIAAFAAGGAFTNQVVASPTLFQFGKGGQLGLMGEAGPEAIMPLQRGPDGKLGVQANGGGGRSVVTTPIVVIGDDAVANAMAGAAGENIVITHVRNNWGALNG